MGPKGKMVFTHRATKARLTKIVLPKQIIRFLAKMRWLGPILGRGTFSSLPFFFNGEQSAENEKGQFLQKNKAESEKLGVTTRKN